MGDTTDTTLLVPRDAEGQPLDAQTQELARDVADQVESYLVALRALARGDAPDSEAVSLLLLVVSQVLLAGARLGVQQDFQPQEEYEPDSGPDPDLDELRLRLGVLLEGVDAYTELFDPYADPPETVSSLISDDLTSIAAALAHGLRHYRDGRVAEALWWWQFSYVATWGTEASAVLRAVQSVIAHDRLDNDFESEQDDVALAAQMLDTVDPAR